MTLLEHKEFYMAPEDELEFIAYSIGIGYLYDKCCRVDIDHDRYHETVTDTITGCNYLKIWYDRSYHGSSDYVLEESIKITDEQLEKLNFVYSLKNKLREYNASCISVNVVNGTTKNIEVYK